MIRQRLITLIISILIISAVFLAGCVGNNESPTTSDSEYIKVTATKNGISFSFKYHITYGLLTPDALQDTGDDPSVSLVYARPGNITDKYDKQLYIRACDPMESRPDAATWMERHINLLEENDAAFELIERSTVRIAGIDGEMAAYHSSILGNYLSSDYTVCWDAYIDYQGYIWKLSVLTIEYIGDQAESDFEHLIESFEFLD